MYCFLMNKPITNTNAKINNPFVSFCYLLLNSVNANNPSCLILMKFIV